MCCMGGRIEEIFNIAIYFGSERRACFDFSLARGCWLAADGELVLHD